MQASKQADFISIKIIYIIISYTKFEHYWIIRFGIMLRIIIVKMHLLILWPWPFNPKTVPLLVYPKIIPYTKFEHFAIIRFVFSYAADRQTDRQTDGRKRPIHADQHSRRE